MAEKLKEPISHVHVWVSIWIAIAVAELYSRIICRSFLTNTLQDRELYWDLILGLGLMQ